MILSSNDMSFATKYLVSVSLFLTVQPKRRIRKRYVASYNYQNSTNFSKSNSSIEDKQNWIRDVKIWEEEPCTVTTQLPPQLKLPLSPKLDLLQPRLILTFQFQPMMKLVESWKLYMGMKIPKQVGLFLNLFLGLFRPHLKSILRFLSCTSEQ